MHSFVVIDNSNIALGSCIFISYLHAEYFTKIKQINKLCRATRFAIQSDHTFFHCLHTNTHSQIQTHFRPLYEYMCIICIKLWFFLCVCAVVGVCVSIQFGVVVVGSSVACTLISIAA